MQKYQRDDRRDQKIRPGLPGPGDQRCSDDHSDIGDRVIAAEQPDRGHVCVAFAKPHQHKRRRDVDYQGRDRDPAHQAGFRRDRVKRAPDRQTDHSKTQRAQKQALCQRDPGARAGTPRKSEDADQRDRSIADEVEGVGLERLAVRQKPAEDLENAKAQIEQYDDPKGAAISRVCTCSLRIACATAIRCFVFQHKPVGNTSSGCRGKLKLRHTRDMARKE